MVLARYTTIIYVYVYTLIICLRGSLFDEDVLCLSSIPSIASFFPSFVLISMQEVDFNYGAGGDFVHAHITL